MMLRYFAFTSNTAMSATRTDIILQYVVLLALLRSLLLLVFIICDILSNHAMCVCCNGEGEQKT